MGAENDTRPAGARKGMSPRIAESVASDLRQRILRSESTGDPLPRQDDLMVEYGVSGPSVREALRILEAEGLITVRRGKFGGAYVHKPNWSSAAFALGMSLQGQGVTLRDLGETLYTLEPLCAAECARRSDRGTTVVPALRANIEYAEQFIGVNGKYSKPARDFHDVVVDHVENQSLRLLVRSMVGIWNIQEVIWASAAQAAHQYPSEDAQRAAQKAHVVLTRLIEEGDAEGAAVLAAAHVKATQEVVLERFGDEFIDASSLAAVQAFKSL